jgi:hypothetical protein
VLVWAGRNFAALRVFIAFCGVVLMLAGQAPLGAFQSNGAATGMACCKKNGHACCHKAHQNGAGPKWEARNCGMPGCGFSAAPDAFPLFTTPGAGHWRQAPVTRLGYAGAGERRPRFAQFPLDLLQLPPPFAG